MNQTNFIGHNRKHFEETDSTNAALRRLAEEAELAEGFIVTADFQTQGRGQMGTQWTSESGENILLSVLLKPGFLEPARQFSLSQCIALATHDLLAALLGSDGLFIKWPNDIFYKGKKLAGILIENAIYKGMLQHAIVGIGININQQHFSLPDAASLKSISGRDYDIERLLPQLLGQIEKYYFQLRQGRHTWLGEQYLKNMLGYGQKLTFERANDGTAFEGIIEGLSESGELLVSQDGLISSYALKELRYL